MQDESLAWVHRGHGVINDGKPAAAGEKVGTTRFPEFPTLGEFGLHL